MIVLHTASAVIAVSIPLHPSNVLSVPLSVLGGLTLSHLEMYKLYGHKPDDHHSHDHKKAHQYLLDVQAEGAVDGLVMCEIALRRGLPIIHNRERDLQQMEYYKQAAMLGCNEGYRLLFHWYWGESKSKKENQDKAIQLLVRGMNERILDDRVLRTLFYAGDVSLYTPGPNVLGQKHSNLSELMLDWIEWFIYRNSSEAYEMKAQLYKYGWDSIPKDESKRVATWLEADKRGLATHQTYLELIMSYMYVIPFRICVWVLPLALNNTYQYQLARIYILSVLTSL